MNQVILIGRLTKDVETKVIPSTNTTVANFTLAVNRDLAKTKAEELKAQGKPTADFIRIIAFGKTAEVCADYLEKGRLVAIQGAIQTSSFKGSDGTMKYSTDVLANKVEFIEWGEKKQETKRAEDDSIFGDYSDDVPF